MDYALFIPEKDIQKSTNIIKKSKFLSIDAGFVEKGKKRVVIRPKNIVFEGKSLGVR